jgi:DNA primase
MKDNIAKMIAALEKTGRKCVIRGDNLYTQCVNPDHKDSDPSCSIRMDGAMFKCWACGISGSWDRYIVQTLGVAPVGHLVLDTADDIRDLLRDVEKASLETEEDHLASMPAQVEDWPVSDSFRNYSGELLYRIGCKVWYDYGPKSKGLAVARLLFPFNMNGKFVGGTGRILPEYEPKQIEGEDDDSFKKRSKDFYKNVHPKYRNLKGIRAKKVFFGYDALPDPCPVVALAEGPTSTLGLLSLGIPSLGILGVENWSTLKRALLLARGVFKIMVVLDGDTPGKDATKVIVQDCEDYAEVHAIYLPDGKDPDSIGRKWKTYLKDYYASLL